jgi:hypothetical protein
MTHTSRLPSEIVVVLKVERDCSFPLSDILVSLNLYCHGRYYYGDLIGLTDDSGTVRITRDRIQLDFDADERLFPMDYKVPLGETDPIVGIVVQGHSDFLSARSAVEESRMVRPDARAAYARARNADVQTSRTQVKLPVAPPDQLIIELTVTAKAN